MAYPVDSNTEPVEKKALSHDFSSFELTIISEKDEILSNGYVEGKPLLRQSNGHAFHDTGSGFESENKPRAKKKKSKSKFFLFSLKWIMQKNILCTRAIRPRSIFSIFHFFALSAGTHN